LFDVVEDLVFLMEVDEEYFRYGYVNQSARRILHFDDENLGNLIEEVLPAERCGLLLPKYREVVMKKLPVNFIETMLTDDGELIGETSLNPIIEDGVVKYIIAIVRDITDRKRKEKELQDTKTRLEGSEK